MNQIYLKDLVELWGAPANSPGYKSDLSFPLGAVFTDSRKVSKGSFFVPLVGKNFDGHHFISQAYSLGAQAAVVSRESRVPIPEGLLYWLVDDTLAAYQELALLYRTLLNIPVIAVTGSVGKTTTRELIRSALAPLGSVVASPHNHNNDIGVPSTLLMAAPKDAAIVIEMGMRGLGEIHRLSSCSCPDVAVITNIGSAHIGRLGSRENIAKAKCEITNALKDSGVVIIPAGNLLLEETLRKNWNGRVLRVLTRDVLDESDNYKDDGSFLFGGEYLIGEVSPDGSLLRINNFELKIPLEGRHNILNFLLAIAVAREFNVPFDKISNLKVDLPLGRNRCLQFGELTVLDETYNSSPESVKAALEVLVSKPGRHFAVLGTMMELGEYSKDFHREVVEKARNLGIYGLILISDGPEAEIMRLSSDEFPCFEIVSRPALAEEILKRWLQSGDVVLLKASRSVGLESLLPFFDSIHELFS